MVAYARNPSTGEAETGGSLGLTGQPVCRVPSLVRDPASKTKQGR